MAFGLFKYGYGAWELIRNELRNTDRFRFNWVVMARTTDQISKRCELLVARFKREMAFEKE